MKNTFQRQWQVAFPDCLPVAHRLRSVFSERWLRIHSLPESKRYADSQEEMGVILERYHAVLDYLMGSSAVVWLVTNEGSESLEPDRSGSRLLDIAPTAECVWNFDPEPEDEEHIWYYHLFVSQWQWSKGVLDPVFKLVANDEISEVMVLCPEFKWIFHPYDGGADLILPTTTDRDQAREKFADWLSKHPLGL